MSPFPDLDEVVATIAAHGERLVSTADFAIAPDQTVPVTTITAVLPGFALTSPTGAQPPYTHCIRRHGYLTSGDDITWVAPNGVLGSTTRGSSAETNGDDNVVDSVWRTILQQLDIDKEPHQR